jgi:hypothetical protein
MDSLQPLPSVLNAAWDSITTEALEKVQRVHGRYDVAAYLLALASCSEILQSNALGPALLTEMHEHTRRCLFALQYALSLRGDVPPTTVFSEAQASEPLVTEHHRQCATDALHTMVPYSYVLDFVLSYQAGAYTFTPLDRTTYRFTDAPGWEGRRDHACRILKTEIDEMMAEEKGGDPLLRFDIPPELPFGAITGRQYSQAWEALCGYMRQVGKAVDVLTVRALVSHIRRRSGLSRPEARCFVRLLTFDRTDRTRTLFHRPLVPLTTNTIAIVAPAILHSDQDGATYGLSADADPGGYSRFTAKRERGFLDDIQTVYQTPSVHVVCRRKYQMGTDEGDLDLVVYDSARGCLFVGMAKTFVPPDTVYDVRDCNTAIQHALDQVERARLWIQQFADNAGRMFEELGLSVEGPYPTVVYGVLTVGFIGSDFLSIPDDVSVVDLRYLLLRRFRGSSMFDVITEYDGRVGQLSRSMAPAREAEIDIGGYRFLVPSQN